MKTKFFAVLALGLAGVMFSPAQDQEAQKLVVHEWGTFTCVAGSDGIDLEWRPLLSKDLPDFVYGPESLASGAGLRSGLVCGVCGGNGCRCGEYGQEIRKGVDARMRMETPVLYFYTDREMDVSVRVGFPKGMITEWYPRARSVTARERANGVIDWGRFKVLPDRGEARALPGRRNGAEQDHYFYARETDAAYVRVCGGRGEPEFEKYLFYRGVGNFALSLRGQAESDRALSISNQGPDEVRHLFAVCVRDGKLRYEAIDSVAAGATRRSEPAVEGSREQVMAALEKALVASGLFEKEARAMVNTWKDTYFEEGLRVLYVLPRRETDQLLPIEISPAPVKLERVLVGRLELISAEAERGMEKLVEKLASEAWEERDAAQAGLKKLGRFAEPFLRRTLQVARDAEVRERIEQLLRGR